MPNGDEDPTKPQIELQLQHMLATARFRTAFSQAEFLSVVVSRTLNEETMTEDAIGRVLFPQYTKDVSTDVRSTARSLRKSLHRYYAAEGRDDLVVIALPEPSKDKSIKMRPGEAYTPVFSYNPLHESSKECALGDYHLRYGGADCFKPALDHYQKALRLNPDHVQAQLGEIEVFLKYLELYTVSPKSREDILLSVGNSIKHVELRAPNFWRTHVVKGAFLLEKHEITDAEAEFGKAIELDKANTQTSKKYRDFLLKTDRFSEALKLTKGYADDHPDDLNAKLEYSHVLCSVKQFEEAEKIIDSVLRIEPTAAYPHLQKMRVLRYLGRDNEARELAKSLRHMLKPLTYSYIANVVGLDEDGQQ